MKTIKYIFALLFTTLLLSSNVGAEYKVYSDVGEFEKDKGAICEAASDGCNNYFMNDGKVMGGTRMFCADHKVEWNCTKYKEGSITTLSLTDTVQTTSNISENDKNFLTHLRENVKKSHQKKVDALLFKIEAKTGRMHVTLANNYYDLWIEAIEKKTNQILLSYPQDIALPEKINNQYLVLQLLKLEIEINLLK